MVARKRRSLDEVLAQTVPEEEPVTTPPTQLRPAEADDPMRKYTVLLSDADHDRAREVTDDVVALAGIRATKSMRGDVLRVLYQLADQDPDIRRRLADLLRAAMPS